MKKNDQDTNVDSLPGDERPVAAKVSRLALEQSIEELPEGIVQRLTEARRAAVLAASKPTVARRRPFTSQYAWGMAASLVLTGVVWLFLSSEQLNNSSEQLSVSSEQFTHGQSIITDEPVTKDLSVHPGLPPSPRPGNPAEDLFTAIELAELDPESMAVLDDLDFLHWLSLGDINQGEDV